MEPYVLEEDAKSFVAALAVNNRHIFTFTYTDFISSKITKLSGYENKTADMTVTLTIQPIDEMNEACKVDDLLLFATLFVAGMWSMWSIVFRSFYFILRCTSPHKRGNHIPREGDIFHSCTRAMEKEFQLITTLFNWTMGHSWKLQTPLTVLTSCTILLCQSTSQPTTVQDTVIPSHLRLSIERVC